MADADALAALQPTSSFDSAIAAIKKYNDARDIELQELRGKVKYLEECASELEAALAATKGEAHAQAD